MIPVFSHTGSYTFSCVHKLSNYDDNVKKTSLEKKIKKMRSYNYFVIVPICQICLM